MARLGTDKKPAIVRVQSFEKANAICAFCDDHGWKVVIGVEPDKSEDLSDLERLINPLAPRRPPLQPLNPKTERNQTCPCGSGLKFKKCCLNKTSSPTG